MVGIKERCKFCEGTGKVSQVSSMGMTTELCFICSGRGFTVMTMHGHDMNPKTATVTTV